VLTKAEFLKYRDRIAAIRERFRALNRERKTQDEVTQTLLKEFNWGSGPAAGNIPGYAAGTQVVGAGADLTVGPCQCEGR
jgi:hypothetical protein